VTPVWEFPVSMPWVCPISAACFCIDGNTWLYTSNVMLTWECPRTVYRNKWSWGWVYSTKRLLGSRARYRALARPIYTRFFEIGFEQNCSRMSPQ
jgi:hypothetical protein